MKKANKWLTLLLAIVMIASIGLAGCGNDAADNEGDGAAPAANEGTSGDDNATESLN